MTLDASDLACSPAALTAAQIIANYRRARRAVRREPDPVPVPVVVQPEPEPEPEPSIALIEALPDNVCAEHPVPAEDDPLAEKPILVRAPTVRRIVLAVAAEYGVAPVDLVSDRRTHDILIPRQLVMYLARHFTTKSYPEIGRVMGGRDHTTVMWGAQRTADRLANSPPVTITRTMMLADVVRAYRRALPRPPKPRRRKR